MKQAINIARTGPQKSNPYVGALIVKDGEVVMASGKVSVPMTLKRNSVENRHAERAVIEMCNNKGIDLRGTTMYVTLEPCMPLKRSVASCTELIVKNGIAKVVFGLQDSPTFNGQSVEYLRLNDVIAQQIAMDPKLLKELTKTRGKAFRQKRFKQDPHHNDDDDQDKRHLKRKTKTKRNGNGRRNRIPTY